MKTAFELAKDLKFHVKETTSEPLKQDTFFDRLSKQRVPVFHEEVDMRNFKEGKFLEIYPRMPEIISSYWKNPNKNLLLYGKPGTGKTTFAMACVKNFDKHGCHWRYVHYASIKEICEGFERLPVWMKETSILVIDDLGQGMPSARTDDKVLDLINFRLHNKGFMQTLDGVKDYKLVTIMTTNLSGKELSERYGEPFMSRLEYVTKIQLDKKDLRADKREDIFR